MDPAASAPDPHRNPPPPTGMHPLVPQIRERVAGAGVGETDGYVIVSRPLDEQALYLFSQPVPGFHRLPLVDDETVYSVVAQLVTGLGDERTLIEATALSRLRLCDIVRAWAEDRLREAPAIHHHRYDETRSAWQCLDCGSSADDCENPTTQDAQFARIADTV
jgi:hypothetical protein